MATVLRVNGLAIVIYVNDHRPAHVHVKHAGCEAVFDLNCPEGPVSLRENFGFALRQLTAIAQDLDRYVSSLCDDWRQIHGDARSMD